jgi:hypothetical protein
MHCSSLEGGGNQRGLGGLPPINRSCLFDPPYSQYRPSYDPSSDTALLPLGGSLPSLTWRVMGITD